MKRITSKILIIFIIVVMMFEFLISSNICNAGIGLNEETINGITNLGGGIVSIVYWPKRITAVSLAFIMDLLTAQVARDSGINDSDGFLTDLLITPFNIFFNKYKLLDVNFFDLDGVDQDKIAYTFRTTVAQWYYVMRLISVTILMIILIYVGIRMALSTIADDKAKYKKMLVDWCCSLVLVFILHYIAIFVIYCNDAIVMALKDGITDLTAETQLSGILVDIGLRGVLGIGITSIAAVLVFIFIVFQTIAFLIAYINRVLKVGFLLIISPLISITYSIDKMGDGKAQALGAWLKEFTYTILIQPFHCIMYMAFVRPAITLLVGNNTSPLSLFLGAGSSIVSPEYNQLVNGVLAILCLKFINDGEKIVRKIFGFQDDNSSTSMAAGMAVGMLAVKNAQKIGMSARKGVNTVKNATGKIGTALKTDAQTGKFKGIVGEKIGGKLQEAAINWDKQENVMKRQKIKDNMKDKISDSLPGKAIHGAKSIPGRLREATNLKADKKGDIRKRDRVKSFLAKQTLKHNSLSSTLGMMGAAMAYSSGSTDALTAIGTGSAVQRGAQELFSSSDNNLANGEVLNDLEEDAKDYEKLGKDIKETKKDIEGDNEALRDVNGYNDYKSKMKEADSYDEKAKKQEEIAKAAREREANLKKSKKRNEARHNAEQAEAQALANRKRAEEAREEAEKNGHDGRFARMLKGEKDGKDIRAALGVEDKNEKLKQLENQHKEKNFYSRESIRSRIQSRMSSPGKSELQAKKNEIIARLTEMKLKDKEKSNKKSTTLTLDEADSIETTAQRLIENTEYGVLSGKGISEFEHADIIGRSLGLNDKNIRENSVFQSIYSATSEYESLQRRKQKVETYNKQAKYGGNSDKLVEIETQKVYDRSASKRRQQSSN